MAGQVQKSKLMQQVGNVSALVKKRVEEGVKTGFVKLPPDIRNGIARVTTVEFKEVAAGKKNAGKMYFRAAGTACEPQYVTNNGSKIKVRGGQTSVMVNCFWDNEKQKGERIDTITNILLMVGGPDLLTPDADWEVVAKKIQTRLDNKTAPPIYVRFSTSKMKQGDKKDEHGKLYPPSYFENWNGTDGLEDYTPPEPETAEGTPAAQDETGDAPSLDETKDTLDAMVANCNNDDGDAQAAIRERAKELGATEEELDDDEEKFPSWESIAEYIRAGGSGDAAPEAEEWEPAKGDKVKHKGKGYVIEAIQGRSKTAHLKGLVGKDKKPLAVKLDELEQA